MSSEASVEVLCLFRHSEVSSTKKVMFVLCLTVMNLNVHLKNKYLFKEEILSVRIWEESVEQLSSLSECAYCYFFVSLIL